MTALVVQGDARRLPLPDQSVDCVITSPPYFALRSYTDKVECKRCRELREGYRSRNAESWEVDRNLREAWPDYDAHVKAEHKPSHYKGQIGSESTPTEYLDALWACTREWMRVLKPEGSIFVNLGDKYSSGSSGDRNSGFNIRWGNAPGRRKQELSQVASRGVPGMAPKSLMGIPWRYAIGCIDQLGLILRAEIIWSKPNGLPESVTDRVRRSHENWFHFTKQPRYYAAVDEVREAHIYPDDTRHLRGGRRSINPNGSPGGGNTSNGNPLGKLPGSVWTIPSEPLQVPDSVGVDHFAAFPTEWPRRLILGWSPPGVCTECGQGRRPVTSTTNRTLRDGHYPTQEGRSRGGTGSLVEFSRKASEVVVTGYTCPCDADGWRIAQGLDLPPTNPALVLDPFGGTGTTALVAHALDRVGISVDMSGDYSRLARWRTTDRGELAKAMRVEKPAPVPDGQMDLFDVPGPPPQRNVSVSLRGTRTCTECGYRSQYARKPACDRCGTPRQVTA